MKSTHQSTKNKSASSTSDIAKAVNSAYKKVSGEIIEAEDKLRATSRQLAAVGMIRIILLLIFASIKVELHIFF